MGHTMNASEIVNALEAILTSLGSGLFSPLPVRRAVAEERALIARLKAEPEPVVLAEGPIVEEDVQSCLDLVQFGKDMLAHKKLHGNDRKFRYIRVLEMAAPEVE
jgi:hypothetical protein